LFTSHEYVPANVPLVGTFTVNPVVAKLVANGWPVVAVLAEGVTEQLIGVVAIAVGNVIATEVADEMLHVPARIEGVLLALLLQYH
jgi:hypothetical protein